MVFHLLLKKKEGFRIYVHTHILCLFIQREMKDKQMNKTGYLQGVDGKILEGKEKGETLP